MIHEKRVVPNQLRRRCDVQRWLLAVVIACFMVFTILPASTLRQPGHDASVSSVSPANSSHDPISIEGNDGFTNASGVVWGSGTSVDPYIIADWDIIPSTSHGIWIDGTDAHFIVRNCFVHDGSPWWNGIYLTNCFNGTLENNNCSSNYLAGISLDSSSRNTLINNSCYLNSYFQGISLNYASNDNSLINNKCIMNGDYGVYLYSSCDNNSIDNNDCIANGYDGIHLLRSCNNSVANNNCSTNFDSGIYLEGSSDGNAIVNNLCGSNEGDGIVLYSSSNNNALINNTCNSNCVSGVYIYSSSNNTLSDNDFNSNSLFGVTLDSSVDIDLTNNTMIAKGVVIIGDSLEYWSTHFIDSSNTLNGHSVCFRANSTGGMVPSGAGQVILANCTNVTVWNQDVSNGSTGIELGFSSNCTLSYDDCSGSVQYGVYLFMSDDNTIVDCNLSSSGDGLYLDLSDNNTIGNNNMSSNDVYGVYLHISTRNMIVNNRCSWNGQHGIFLDIWSNNNTVDRNTCSGNGYHGIVLSNSGGDTVSSNICINNYDGVGIYFSWSNHVSNNSCLYGYYGMDLPVSNGNIFDGNNCSHNYVGMIFSSTTNSVINDNSYLSNSYYAIYLDWWSNGNTVWNNTFGYNNGSNETYNPFHIQAFDRKTGNSWNSTNGYGNSWSDWQGPDVSPANGIVDYPYLIDGGACSYDHYPHAAHYSPPVAVLSVFPAAGYTATPFTLDASASWDTKDPTELLSVRWDWEGDGTFDTGWSTDKIVTHVYSVAGVYSPTVEVMDSDGLTSVATAKVGVSLAGISASIDFEPHNLNPLSAGKWVSVYIELPSGYDAKDILVDSIRLGGHIPATGPFGLEDFDKDKVPELMIKFDRNELSRLLDAKPGSAVEITVSGSLKNGTMFQGSDNITIVPDKHRRSVLAVATGDSLRVNALGVVFAGGVILVSAGAVRWERKRCHGHPHASNRKLNEMSSCPPIRWS